MLDISMNFFHYVAARISITKNGKSWADNRPSILVHFLQSFYSSNKGIASSYCIQIALGRETLDADLTGGVFLLSKYKLIR